MPSNEEIIAALVAKARVAQKQVENYTQEQIDEVALSVAWQVYKDENIAVCARSAVDETGKGVYQLVSDWDEWEKEMDWMKRLSISTGRPVGFVLFYYVLKRMPAVAAWIEALLACTKLPAAFFIDAYGTLLVSA